MTYKLLTRNSQLALWQATHIRDLCRSVPQLGEVEIVSMTTAGDQNLTDRLAKVGGKGLFIGNLEDKLRTYQGDFAVHSYKDVPVHIAADFTIAAVLPRGAVADVLVSNHYDTLAQLPQGAVIGTSSLRRMSQLLLHRPDFKIVPMRGNLNTRLAKLDNGQCDALILAAAGLERLGFQSRIRQVIERNSMLPAVAQGALAIETRSDDAIVPLLATLGCAHTTAATQAERAFARTLQADCSAPVAALACVTNDTLTLTGRIIAHDGTRCLEHQLSGSLTDAEHLGAECARILFSQGGAALLTAAQVYIAAL